MPRKGYSSLTVPEDFKDLLKREADALKKSLPDYLQALHDAFIDAEAKGNHLIEVSPKAYRLIKYLAKGYKKDPKEIVQRFIDAYGGANP